MLSPVLGLSLGLFGFSGVGGVSGFSGSFGFSLKVIVCPLSSISLCSVTFFGSSGLLKSYNSSKVTSCLPSREVASRVGLKRGTVQLEPHDKQWDEAAIQTIKNLKSILGDDAVDIQHIGSTAIPAIKAKPIIDIVVGVTDFEKIMSYNEQLQKDGIFYRGSDVEDQILYVMGDMEKDIRTHHIHIVKWNGTEWKNYIHFRDYLNDNENMALQYQRVKEELESKYADNRGLYTKGKKDIIDIILNN